MLSFEITAILAGFIIFNDFLNIVSAQKQLQLKRKIEEDKAETAVKCMKLQTEQPKKARTCKKCGRPMKGHKRGHCAGTPTET